VTTWVRDGRLLQVVEDSPGVVHVTTEAIHQLLRLAGFAEVPEPIKGVAVQGTTDVLRDEHGRCQECGTSPAQNHRTDCPHAAAGDGVLRRDVPQPGASYELRPGPTGTERR